MLRSAEHSPTSAVPRLQPRSQPSSQWASGSAIAEEAEAEAAAVHEALVTKEAEAPLHFHALQSFRQGRRRWCR